MKERIKLLSINYKKMKPTEISAQTELIEEYAPDMYDSIFAVGAEEGIKKVVDFRPEIIFLNEKIKDTLGLLKKIKQMHPPAVVFIFLSVVDDEQEAIDEYIASGACKCYVPPIIMDTLIHDMYVALNLE